jgi:hypothetical protein
LSTPLGAKFDLITHPNSMPADQASDDVAVLIEGAGAKSPQKSFAGARRRREASRRGKQLDPRSRLAAAFVILATGLPAARDFRHAPLALAN